ncbi:MAG: sulfatase-like hydrolase/transferase [Acidobacteriota bacterium]
MRTRWIDRRRATIAATLPLLVLSACNHSTPPEAPPPKPRNVLLVSIDTLRADRIGRTPSLTPAIDALAARGVLYEQARSSVPLTLPSHSVLLTGLYPFDLGVRDNGTFRLDARFETLAEILSARGYRTGAVVGAYVLNHRFGLAQGFDRYDDAIPESGQVLLTPERRAADVVDRAKAWISEDATRPFFAFVHIFDPHAAYAAPEPWKSRIADPYDAEVAYADSALGDLLSFLDGRGLRDSTIVVLVSDHGESLGEHGERTHGLFLYDATLRVPLVIAAPGLVLPGARFAGQARLVDVVPTVLSLLALPAKPGLRGRSLWPLPVDGAADCTYAETLFPFYNLDWSGSQALVRARRKYILSARPEVYDLGSDPGEKAPHDPASTDDAMRGDLVSLAGTDVAIADNVGPEVREKLRSLGYLGGTGRSSAGSDRLALPDPKDRIATFATYDDAIVKLHAGDNAGGMTLLEDILKDDPRSVMALSFLGAAAFEAKDLARSESAYRSALAQAPDRADLHAELARTLASGDRPDDAMSEVDRAIALDAGSAMALSVKAEILAKRGDLAGARTILAAAREKDDESTAIAAASPRSPSSSATTSGRASSRAVPPAIRPMPAGPPRHP